MYHRPPSFAYLSALLLLFTVLAGCLDTPPGEKSGGEDVNDGNPLVPPIGGPNDTSAENQTLWLNGSRTMQVILYEADSHSVSGNPVTRESGWNCIVFRADEVHSVNSGTLTATWEPEDDVHPVPELLFFWSVFGELGNDDRRTEGGSPLTLEMEPVKNVDDIFVGVREPGSYSVIQNLTVEFTWNVQYEGLEEVEVDNGGC